MRRPALLTLLALSNLYAVHTACIRSKYLDFKSFQFDLGTCSWNFSKLFTDKTANRCRFKLIIRTESYKVLKQVKIKASRCDVGVVWLSLHILARFGLIPNLADDLFHDIFHGD